MITIIITRGEELGLVFSVESESSLFCLKDLQQTAKLREKDFPFLQMELPFCAICNTRFM